MSAPGRRTRPRTRRDPEASRELIHRAAAALLAEAGPDEVSVRAIAARAGVSHGLVTHYFGSYQALVREVLARKRQAALAQLVDRLGAVEGEADGSRLLDPVLDFLMDPVRLRLRAWLAARGADPTAPGNVGLLLQVAAFHLDRLRARRGLPPLPVAVVEDVVRVVLAATQGFPHTAAGRASREAEARFRATLKDMILAFLARASPP